jgi:lipopolysaccharide transport system permease protein
LFGGVMKVSTNGIPPLLFYLCSLLGWTYFSNVLSATATSLSNNARVFSKVYFPRLIPPLAVTVSNLVGFVIQFLFFCCAYTYYKFFTDYGTQLSLSAWAFLFPVLILQVAMLGLGTGLVITSLTAKYRDLTNLTGLFIQLWMYMTPVIYPLSRIPERWRWVAQINPMTAVVETMRLAFLHSGDVTIAGYGLSFGMTCVILVTGVLCYQRMARTFIDTF